MSRIEKKQIKIKHFILYSEMMQNLMRYLESIKIDCVLEAGCGSQSPFMYENCYIYGIDLSEKDLEVNKIVNEKILADLEVYDNNTWIEKFDLIVSWYVFEHLNRPDLVLRKLAKWSKKGGMIILAFPNLSTLIGLITKFTPYWLHVVGRILTYMIYDKNLDLKKIIQKAKLTTFPTVYHKSLKLENFYNLLMKNEFEILQVYSVESDKNIILKKFLPYKTLNKLIYSITSSRLFDININATDLVFILRKK